MPADNLTFEEVLLALLDMLGSYVVVSVGLWGNDWPLESTSFVPIVEVSGRLGGGQDIGALEGFVFDVGEQGSAGAARILVSPEWVSWGWWHDQHELTREWGGDRQLIFNTSGGNVVIVKPVGDP